MNDANDPNTPDFPWRKERLDPEARPDPALVERLVRVGAARSKAEARRLVAQGAVWQGRGGMLMVGRRFFAPAEGEDAGGEVERGA